MGSIFTLGMHHLKLLFKSKSLLLVLFLFPFIISAGITYGLQKAYVPLTSNLSKPKCEEESIKFVAKKANDAAEKFKTDSDLYPTIKKQLEGLGMDRDLPEVTANITTNFLEFLLPTYYPKIGKIISHSMSQLNIILIVIFSISFVPAICGVFLMNQDKTDQTMAPIIAQGISSSEYLLSKIFAGFVIACEITLLSLFGYVIGVLMVSGNTTGNLPIYLTLAITCLFGAFSSVTISILFSLIISEFKTQILICGILTPIIIIGVYFCSIKEPVINNSIKDIKDQFAVVKIERLPVDKKVFDLLGERQMYDRSRMAAVKIGSDIIPSAIQKIPSSAEDKIIDSKMCSLIYFLTTAAICIFLSLILSTFRFRKQ